MTSTTILAIDLGKYKCVSCAYDRAAEFRALAVQRGSGELARRRSRDGGRQG